MANSLRPVTVAPKGMGLYDFVALQEGFFAADPVGPLAALRGLVTA